MFPHIISMTTWAMDLPLAAFAPVLKLRGKEGERVGTSGNEGERGGMRRNEWERGGTRGNEKE